MVHKKVYQDFNASRYACQWEVNPAETVRVNTLIDLAGTGKRILDIGCYDGTIASLLKNKNNQVFGIELSEKALQIVRQRTVFCLKGDLNETLPFQDDTFDLVVCAEVIEHIFQTKKFLLEIKRVLKKGGQLLISTPNLASLGRRLFLFFGRNPLIEIDVENSSAGHIRYFVKSSLFELLKRYDFRVEKFCSDVVNFDNSGKYFSIILARFFPGLGKSLIVKACNEK